MAIALVFFAACGGGEATSAVTAAPATDLPATDAPANVVPAPSSAVVPVAPAPAGGLVAPDRYAGVVPRQTFPFGARYRNLVYEGNNMAMRGPKADDGTWIASGVEVRDRWRSFARGVAKVIVLRDSLFSQQDHPTDQVPAALLLPPSWVTAAVAEVEAGRALRGLVAPEPDDDAAWAAIASAAVMFGSFPGSGRLFELAVRTRTTAMPGDRLRIENARISIRSLARDTSAMVAAASGGPDAVARAGAEAMAASDRAYFGDAIRREHILPIFVENPTPHEIVDEGKGFVIAGREIDAVIVRRARDAIIRRRLADGDVAIERYDLSRPEERRRAIVFLEAIVPEGAAAPGGVVWVWVNGPLDALGIRGEDATAYVVDFRAELEAARIDLSRVRLFSKPHVDLPRGEARRLAFEAAVDRFRTLDLPLSVNLDTRALRALVGP